MNITDFNNTYWNYYLQIEKDFFETAPYCTIDKCNDKAFSVKYLQLHLSICSEIDTICKTLCKTLDDTLNLDSCGIKDYMRILNKSYHTFTNETVKLHSYKYRDIQPWKGIDENHTPNWWNVYNDVKHHRDTVKSSKENYKLATQKNVIQALCALYIVIEYWAAKNFVFDKNETHNKYMASLKSKSLYMDKWRFYPSFMGQSERFDNSRYFKYIGEE